MPPKTPQSRGKAPFAIAMASTLATQLDQLAKGREERVRGRASLLYDSQQAADVDLQAIYAGASKGALLLTRRSQRARQRRQRLNQAPQF